MAFTLKQACTLSGIGIHSGAHCTITCQPSVTGNIHFIVNNQRLPVSPDSLAHNHNRATFLVHDTVSVHTPEHLLAACAALSLSSLDIQLTGPEIPILDGSSKEFLDTFLAAGLDPLPLQPTPIHIKETHSFIHHDSCIVITPSTESVMSYYLHYPTSFIGAQLATISMSQKNFESDIAAARTFGFEQELNTLKQQGLAKGGSLENALVVGTKTYINPPRCLNECAKHKLLDLIGDLWILNRPIIGHIMAIKSGHALNATVCKALYDLYK